MLTWATQRLGLASAESASRFVAIQKSPDKLNDNVELRNTLLDFIADFANWDNSTVQEYLDTSKALTQAAHEALGGEPGTRPFIVDPFAGGGSIPLEALRVGADAFASDFNPVPVLLNTVTLEYIPKYKHALADEVRKWGIWLREQADLSLSEYFPKDPDGSSPIAYIWARTIKCEGPGCGAEIPLLRSLWLSKKAQRPIGLKIQLDVKTKSIGFAIVEGKIDGPGTVRRSSATCPLCGYTTPSDSVRTQIKNNLDIFVEGRLVAVVTTSPKSSGRTYRTATVRDEACIQKARAVLTSLARQPHDATLSPIPTEELPYLRSIFNVHLLGADKWSKLFTHRQLLTITTLVSLLRRLKSEPGFPSGKFGAAVRTCLAFAIDRHIDQQSVLVTWIQNIEAVSHTFVRQALGITWDFCEPNPLSDSGGNIAGAIEWVAKVIDQESEATGNSGVVQLASAASHPLTDDCADLFVTDPPYYDAVPYADLADYFYVWLKRMLADDYPELFKGELSPKDGEIVQLAERNSKYAYKTKAYFERLMTSALSEARRFTIPSGLGVIVFAHKGTGAWETMLASVINSGWIVVASWPIDTERTVRLRAMGSAALGSSIHLVCRPRENPDGSIRADQVGDWRDVLLELPHRIHEWMPRLAEEGVVGADAIFACLGPALEIYSRYSRVEKANGELVALGEFLEQVWAAVAKEALALVFRDADVTGFEADARLTAMWLWTLQAAENGATGDEDEEAVETEDESESGTKKSKAGGFVLEYDAARKIAQGLGAHLEALDHLVEISGETARLLPVAERMKHLFGKDEEQAPTQATKKKKSPQLDMFTELVESGESEAVWREKTVERVGDTTLDRIHQSMILFAAGRGEALKRFLVEDGVGRDGRFWRLAQALSALYPGAVEEKRWVDGVLARKKGLGF